MIHQPYVARSDYLAITDQCPACHFMMSSLVLVLIKDDSVMKIAMARIQNSTPFCAILGISKDKKGNKSIGKFSFREILAKMDY